VGGDGRSLCVNDAGNKELVGGGHESRRVEDTTKGGQDSLSVVFLMMMIMMHQWNIPLCSRQCCFKNIRYYCDSHHHTFRQSSNTRYHNQSWLTGHT